MARMFVLEKTSMTVLQKLSRKEKVKPKIK